jgi:hypothetical protein
MPILSLRTNDTPIPCTWQVEISLDNFRKLRDEQLKLPDPTAFLVGLNLNPHSKPYVRLACRSCSCFARGRFVRENARRRDELQSLVL